MKRSASNGAARHLNGRPAGPERSTALPERSWWRGA